MEEKNRSDKKQIPRKKKTEPNPNHRKYFNDLIRRASLGYPKEKKT